jgi:hypothetical protein
LKAKVNQWLGNFKTIGFADTNLCVQQLGLVLLDPREMEFRLYVAILATNQMTIGSAGTNYFSLCFKMDKIKV